RERCATQPKSDQRAEGRRRDHHLGRPLAEDAAEPRRHPAREIARADLDGDPRELAASMPEARDPAREVDWKTGMTKRNEELAHEHRPHWEGSLDLDPEQSLRDRETKRRTVIGRLRCRLSAPGRGRNAQGAIARGGRPEGHRPLAYQRADRGAKF